MESRIIELEVNNHPGVFSQIAGLFSRRAFNLEGILCLAVGDETKSKIMLLVKEDERIDQIVKQLEKLYDVLKVTIKDEDKKKSFEKMKEVFE